ncbi:MAG: co-chaperone GroES [Bacteroidota bacterium]
MTNKDFVITPLFDRVLVQPDQKEQKTASGLYIPDTAQKKPQRGVVIAVGPGKKDEPMVLKKDDKVLYGEYSGTEIEIEGKKYLIMRQSDAFATMKS